MSFFNWRKSVTCLLLYFVSFVAYSESITVGTTAGYPPFASRSDNQNHFFGFEIDIMNEICKRLDLACEYQVSSVGDIPEKLTSNAIDFAIATMVIPDQPDNKFIFSESYLPSYRQFMVLKSSNINTFDDLFDKTVGVRHSGMHELNEFKKLIMRMYKTQINVKEYPTINDVLAALSNEEIDAIVSNSKAINYWYHNNENLYRLIGQPFPLGKGYGIISTPKYSMLMQRINMALEQMKNDGTYEKIYNQYFSELK